MHGVEQRPEAAAWHLYFDLMGIVAVDLSRRDLTFVAHGDDSGWLRLRTSPDGSLCSRFASDEASPVGT
jgi:hypothetical protein